MTADPTRILDEIQARADAATEGPWTWAARTTADGDEWAVFDGGDSALAANRDGWAPDAAFIAAARTDVPRLVAALRAVLEEHKPHECNPLPKALHECFIVHGGGCAYVGTCDTCRTAHPCTTRQAMAEALEER